MSSSQVAAARRWIDAHVGDGSHLRIVRGLVLVGLFVMVGKLAAAAREVAVAWRYGIGDIVDSYVFTFGFITWLPGVWASILVATYVPLIHRLERAEASIFRAQLHAVGIALAVASSALVYLALPPLLPLLAGDATPELHALMERSARQMAPLAGLSILGGLYASMLLAAERHANTLLEALPPIVVVTFLFAWQGPVRAEPLVWGTVAGVAVQVAALYALLRRGHDAPAVSWSVASPAWTSFRQAVGVLALSQLALSLALPIDQMLAARLDEGSLATLGFANRVLALALGLGATAVGRAILPVLSDRALDVERRSAIATRWFAIMIALGLLMVGVGWVLAQPVVALLFERGAFEAADTVRVASVVRFGLLQMPFFFAGIVTVQLFASLRLYRFIVVSGLVAIGAKLLTGPLLTARYGVEGIVISTALTYAASAGYFLWHLRRGTASRLAQRDALPAVRTTRGD